MKAYYYLIFVLMISSVYATSYYGDYLDRFEPPTTTIVGDNYYTIGTMKDAYVDRSLCMDFNNYGTLNVRWHTGWGSKHEVTLLTQNMTYRENYTTIDAECLTARGSVGVGYEIPLYIYQNNDDDYLYKRFSYDRGYYTNFNLPAIDKYYDSLQYPTFIYYVSIDPQFPSDCYINTSYGFVEVKNEDCYSSYYDIVYLNSDNNEREISFNNVHVTGNPYSQNFKAAYDEPSKYYDYEEEGVEKYSVQGLNFLNKGLLYCTSWCINPRAKVNHYISWYYNFTGRSSYTSPECWTHCQFFNLTPTVNCTSSSCGFFDENLTTYNGTLDDPEDYDIDGPGDDETGDLKPFSDSEYGNSYDDVVYENYAETMSRQNFIKSIMDIIDMINSFVVMFYYLVVIFIVFYMAFRFVPQKIIKRIMNIMKKFSEYKDYGKEE